MEGHWDLVGRDRATGIGAKYMDNAIEVMNEEGEKWWILLCTTPRQHLVSISYAIEPCQRKKSRKDPLRNSFLVWDFEYC